VLVVPPGTGAFLYITLCENLGLPDDVRNKIGCRIVNTLGETIIGLLRSHSVDVYEELISFEQISFHYALGHHSVGVLQATPTCASTDSLAAAAVEWSGARIVVMFKYGVPIYHSGFETPTRVLEFDENLLKRAVVAAADRPGAHPLLDCKALEYFAALRPRFIFADPVVSANLAEVICEPMKFNSTVIRWDAQTGSE
jgi:hypothetical protein